VAPGAGRIRQQQSPTAVRVHADGRVDGGADGRAGGGGGGDVDVHVDIDIERTFR
jgi:hypothetical protein